MSVVFVTTSSMLIPLQNVYVFVLGNLMKPVVSQIRIPSIIVNSIIIVAMSFQYLFISSLIFMVHSPFLDNVHINWCVRCFGCKKRILNSKKFVKSPNWYSWTLKNSASNLTLSFILLFIIFYVFRLFCLYIW